MKKISMVFALMLLSVVSVGEVIASASSKTADSELLIAAQSRNFSSILPLLNKQHSLTFLSKAHALKTASATLISFEGIVEVLKITGKEEFSRKLLEHPMISLKDLKVLLKNNDLKDIKFLIDEAIANRRYRIAANLVGTIFLVGIAYCTYVMSSYLP